MAQPGFGKERGTTGGLEAKSPAAGGLGVWGQGRRPPRIFKAFTRTIGLLILARQTRLNYDENGTF